MPSATRRGPSRAPVPGRRGGTEGLTGSASMRTRSRGHAKRRCSEAATLAPRPRLAGPSRPGGSCFSGPGAPFGYARAVGFASSERACPWGGRRTPRSACCCASSWPACCCPRPRGVSPGPLGHVHRDAGGAGCRQTPCGPPVAAPGCASGSVRRPHARPPSGSCATTTSRRASATRRPWPASRRASRPGRPRPWRRTAGWPTSGGHASSSWPPARSCRPACDRVRAMTGNGSVADVDADIAIIDTGVGPVGGDELDVRGGINCTDDGLGSQRWDDVYWGAARHARGRHRGRPGQRPRRGRRGARRAPLVRARLRLPRLRRRGHRALRPGLGDADGDRAGARGLAAHRGRQHEPRGTAPLVRRGLRGAG